MKGYNVSPVEELAFLCEKGCKVCFFNYASSISADYVFSGLRPREVCNLIKHTDYKIKTWGKDEIIIHNGDSLNYLYLIARGCVICEVMSFSGKVLRIGELGAAEIIGSNFLFGQNNKIPFDIVAKESVKAILIRRSHFIKLMMSDERIMTNYLNNIANWSHVQSKRLKLLGLNSLKGKVAYYLIECAESKNCTSYTLDNNQHELAEMFGVARQSITRIIKHLDENKIISSKGKKIAILDEEALRSLIR